MTRRGRVAAAARWLVAGGVVVALGATVGAGGQGAPPASRPPAPAPAPQGPATFSVQINLVTTDVVPRDSHGQFIADLTKKDFTVLEDGVPQDIASLTMVHGGRVSNLLTVQAAKAPEGIILPSARATDDISGRIFVFFVDDLHIDFKNTARVRDLFQKMAKNLVHDGDMFGVVSTGSSNIAIDLTYDRARLQEAIDKMTGAGMSPDDIIQEAPSSGAAGAPPELRHRTLVAFKTLDAVLQKLSQVHDRRKAVVYVSEGYDLIPFQNSRLMCNTNSTYQQNDISCLEQNAANDVASANNQAPPNPDLDPNYLNQTVLEESADAQLAQQMVDIEASANRANASFYTMDPRGLVAGAGDIGSNLDPDEWHLYVTRSQDSLRVLADQTGGVAAVDVNDFDKAIKRIDAETSDYYMLGFYSNNPDPTKRARKLTVKVDRPDVTVWARNGYTLQPQATATPAAAPAKAPAPSRK